MLLAYDMNFTARRIQGFLLAERTNQGSERVRWGCAIFHKG
jgi:hypothetical protein